MEQSFGQLGTAANAVEDINRHSDETNNNKKSVAELSFLVVLTTVHPPRIEGRIYQE